MANLALSQSRAVPVLVDEAFERVLAHPLSEIFRRRRLAIPPIITWTWEVTPTTAGRVAMPAFATMWRGYARQALEEIEAILLR